MSTTETTTETITHYTYGHGHTTPKTHEVLLLTETADGKILTTDVVLTVPSQAKAQAIAMILNAPENY